jgi:cytochrome c-type biogenesis protein CcmF
VATGSFDAIWKRAIGLPRSVYGMVVAHAGIAIVAAGIASVSAWSAETVTQITVGQIVKVAAYDVTLLSVGNSTGPNYETIVGTFRVASNGKPMGEMVAERRHYPFPGSETTEAAIRVRPLDILYITLGEQANNGVWTVRIYHHPLVAWIWSGCVIMVLGGVLSLSDRRLRVGAPRRAAPIVAATAPAE